MNDKLEYEVGSENVFVDIGREDADEMLARAEMLRQINSIIAHREPPQMLHLLDHTNSSRESPQPPEQGYRSEAATPQS
jgi:hypothetical protein